MTYDVQIKIIVISYIKVDKTSIQLINEHNKYSLDIEKAYFEVFGPNIAVLQKCVMCHISLIRELTCKSQ
jgi:cbb3-type cytochrome oxidase cytochrome c subunit